MTRTQIERFGQDRLGNANRLLDEIRSLDGMEEDDGIVEITSDDTESDVVLMELPEDANGVYINEVHAYNDGDSEDTFEIYEAELNDDGEVDSTTMRSVPYNVSDGVTRTIPYSGKEISGDAIVVNSNFEGYIGVGCYTDRKEEYEPAVEQMETPS